MRGLVRSVGALIVTGAVIAACSGGAPPSRPTGSAAPPATGTGLEWRSLAAAPSSRSEVATAVVGQRIYVAGGFAENGSTTNVVEVYDAASNRWSDAPSLPEPVNHPMAAAVNGVPYVFGGADPSGPPIKSAYRLDGDTWRRAADMPQHRVAGTAVVVDGSVYVAGGIDGSGGVAKDMLVYQPDADRWTIAPGLPTPREHLGGAGFDGRLFIVSGRAAGQGDLDAFEVYDPKTNRWDTLAKLPTRRGGLAATATCNGQIVAVGGEADATFPQAEVYDIATSRWRSLPDAPTARHGLGVASIGSAVFVLDGGRTPGLSTSAVNESIDIGSLGPCRT